MLDPQAWYVRDVILGNIVLPSEVEIQKDIENWICRMNDLSNMIEKIDYQADYIKDLFDLVDCPKFNVDLVSKYMKELEQLKRDDILTYRDKSFISGATGTAGSMLHTDWLHTMDDSSESFLQTS